VSLQLLLSELHHIPEIQWLLWLGVVYVGASVGSFLNVVVYRIPKGMSLIHPGSRCPFCQTPLGPTENIPILGWIWLRGRCRHCKTPISWRYPTVEAGVMLLYVLSFGVLGWTPQAMTTVIFLSWLVALALIDLDTFLLPEELTQSGLVVGALVQAALPWLMGEGSWHHSWSFLVKGILGAVVGIWSLESTGILARLVLKRDAMGLGDGKLLAMIGMWIGWQGVILTIFLASFLGTLGSGIGLALKQVQLGRPIPFGPYLAMGAAVAALVGSKLIQGYLDWSGLTL
jgi:leader peptidase (prepilin peptidase)/N-methyltransferase